MTDNNENEVNEITEETSEAIHTDDAEMDDSVPVEENLQKRLMNSGIKSSDFRLRLKT